MAVQAGQDQRAIWFTDATGRRICVERGGYLRQVVIVETKMNRDLITGVLGWVDTRDGDAESLAQQLAA